MTAGAAWDTYAPTDADGMPLSPARARRLCPSHEAFGFLPGDDDDADIPPVASIVGESAGSDLRKVRLAKDIESLLLTNGRWIGGLDALWRQRYIRHCLACGGAWVWWYGYSGELMNQAGLLSKSPQCDQCESCREVARLFDAEKEIERSKAIMSTVAVGQTNGLPAATSQPAATQTQASPALQTPPATPAVAPVHRGIQPSSMFKPATRKKLKLRMALCAPAKAGKTLTSLRFAFALGQRVAVIDSENRSASKYQGDEWDGNIFNFDVLELADFSPTAYTVAIQEAARCGYDVLVIDSFSHAWMGEGGTLSIVDRKSSAGKNSFTDGWREATPLHNRMIDAVIRCPIHVIATMRSKMEYVLEEQKARDGRTIKVPVKVGMGPIQRAGVEYEFDIVCDIDQEHILTVSGSRCRAIDRAKIDRPGAVFMAPVIHWLDQGNVIPQELIDAAGFTVMTDEEIAAAQAATNGQPAPEKPKVDAKELMRQRAAGVAAAVPGVMTANNMPAATAQPAAASVQTQQPAAIQPTTQQSAGQPITPGTPAAAATTAPVQAATPTGEQAAYEARTNGPCTRLQLEEIKVFRDQLVASIPDINDRIKAMLDALGKSLKDLTWGEAENLKGKLQVKVNELALSGGGTPAAATTAGEKQAQPEQAQPAKAASKKIEKGEKKEAAPKN